MARCVESGSNGRDFYTCHAGLYDFSTPVCLPNGTEIAYLLCGQVVDESCGKPDFRAIASACGVDAAALEEDYRKRRKAPAFRHGDISRQRLLSLIRTFV